MINIPRSILIGLLVSLVMLIVILLSYQTTSYGYFFAGVGAVSNLYSITIWFGLIVLILLIDYIDYKQYIKEYGYIYLVAGGATKLFNLAIKSNMTNLCLFLLSYNLIPVVINFNTIDWLLAIKLNVIFFCILLVYKIIILVFSQVFNNLIGLLTVGLIVLIVPLVTQNNPDLYLIFPINYVMQFRISIFENLTTIPILAIITSIGYVGVTYIISLTIMRKTRDYL